MSDTITIISIVIGWIACILVGLYAIPQLVKVLKTKNTSSLSVLMYASFLTANLLMLAWAIGNTIRTIENGGNFTMIALSLTSNVVLNTLNASVNCALLIIKIRHLYICKKKNIDEIKLSKILLKQKKGAK